MKYALPLTLLFALLAGPSHARETRRPNILWLIAEDMGPHLGVYGTPEVQTPALDGLARRGMLFMNAFTTAPVCSPSRSAFHTGMYQMTIGAHNHRSHRKGDGSAYPWPLPEGVRLVTDWLRDAGYYTGNIVTFPEGVRIGDAPLKGTGKTDWNFTYEGKPFDTNRWEDLKAHQPFFAEVNFSETHRGKEWDLAHQVADHRAEPAKVRIPPYYPDHPVVREDYAQYLNAAMALDKRVGLVLEQLKRDGLADNTIVIFVGDNGEAHVRGKQWPYDSGLHVPLIVYWPEALPLPKGYRRGGRTDQLVSAIDLTATTLAFAGLPKPDAMQGRVLMGPTAEPPRTYLFGGRDRGDETVDRIRTVRSRQYRYIRNFYPERGLLQHNGYKETTYPAVMVIRKLGQEGRLNELQQRLLAPTRPPEELYDVLADPYETRNLAGNPKYAKVLQELRAELDGWILESGDQGEVAEPPAVLEYYRNESEKNYGARIKELRKEWGLPEEAP